MIDGKIQTEVSDHILTVTIDRPAAKNALTTAMLTDLERAFVEFAEDDDLWVAILTGSGPDAFCAGGDLGEALPAVTSGNFRIASEDPVERFFSHVFKPIIGAVNGICYAGGLEILQGTDIRICADTARFALGEVRWGLIPAGGSHIRLPRQVPWAVAMELLLTGRPISAERAREVGLVNYVVDPSEVMTEARRWADVLCANGPLAVRTAKEIAVRGLMLDAPFTLETALSPRVYSSADAKEGPAAFTEQRQPRFRGE